MGRPPLSLADRARGLLLGLASGHALRLGAEGVRGPRAVDGVRDVVRADSPASPWGDDVALAALLAEELCQPEVDLHRLAERWITWWRQDGRGLDASTAAALEHLARHDAPVTVAPADDAAPLARCLPLAVPACRQPRNLVSGTYHTVLLTHPDPRSAWAAVALNVAAASFLRDRRDFIPDVIEALLGNDAPPDLLGRVRRVPFIERAEAGGGAAGAVAAAELVLWLAYHEPSLERALVWLVNREGGTATIAAAAGGLLGVRDGDQAIPVRWVEALPDPGYLRGLAKRLAAPREVE
jgi:ADP-ribosylglycohydrolase